MIPKILVKLGGSLLDSPESQRRLASELARLARTVRLVVVHGGGKQMTRFLAERGVESRFINGLRVTTPDVIDAVVKVFAGSVNAGLVAALRGAGANPVGLSGISAGLVEATPLSEELGMVGKPMPAEGRLLDLLAEAGFLPVVACVAGDAEGRIYNVNGDQMASACARSFSANKLLFLTDVDGVRDAHGKTRGRLTVEEARQLIRDGVATGGMQAKLEAAISALEHGVGEVLIAPGAEAGLLDRIMVHIETGTFLVPQ